MSTPLVSFLLPTCNSGATLAAALDSLEEQTEKDHEVVVVDDGSTDGTADLLARRGAAPACGSCASGHAGLLSALNRGLAECRGPLRGAHGRRRPVPAPNAWNGSSRSPRPAT